MPALNELARVGSEFAPEIEDVFQGLFAAEGRSIRAVSLARDADLVRSACSLGGHLPSLQLGESAQDVAILRPGVAQASSKLSETLLTHGPISVPDNMVAIPSASAEGNLIKPWYKVLPKDSYQAKVFQSAQDSTVHISVSGNPVGSGLIVGDEKFIGTANHVVQNPDALYHIHVSGHEPIPARLIGNDPIADLALLKPEHTNGLPAPAKLISHWGVKVHEAVMQVSRPSPDALYMTEGQAAKFGLEPYAGDIKPRDGADTDIVRIGYTNETFPGSSGSGMFSKTGGVFAMHTHGSENYSLATGTASEHLQSLINAVKQHSPFTGWLTQDTRAFWVPVSIKGVPPTRFGGVISTARSIVTPVKVL